MNRNDCVQIRIAGSLSCSNITANSIARSGAEPMQYMPGVLHELGASAERSAEFPTEESAAILSAKQKR
jgi:hypothetical protein